MAQITAFVQVDPQRASEQSEFVHSRATVLRESGGQYWVRMEEAQIDTLLSQGLAVTPFPDAGVLQVGPIAYRPASETPDVPAALRAPAPEGEAPGHWIVHFTAPVDKVWLQEVELAGAVQLHVLDPFSGVFQLTAAAVEVVRGFGWVDSVALFHPAYVVAMDLAGLDEPLTPSTMSNLSVTLPASAPEGNLQVRVFDGLDPETLRGPLEARGATVVASVAHGFLLRVEPSAASEVLSTPGLLAASPPSIRRLFNHNAGVITGVNQVRDLGTVNFLVNLDGRGEVGAVVDSGFDVGNLLGGMVGGAMTAFHPDLAALRLLRNSATPQVLGLNVPDGVPHGTHVAGTVAGSGVSALPSTGPRGMAPNAALVGLAPLPANVRVPFDFAAVNGARCINNSWGSSFLGVPNNNRYTPTESHAVDRWCFDNPDVLVLFAAGNDERDTPASNGVLDARRLGLEATAKNVLTVGASENLRNDGGYRDSYRAFYALFFPAAPPRYNHAAFNGPGGGAPGTFSFSDSANHVALFSDRGQVRTNGGANTQRIKPDIVAPGTNVLSTRSQMTPPPPLPGPPPIPDPFYGLNFDSMLPPGLPRNLYEVESGTSMATPIVTGASLLVRQSYRTRFAQMRRPLLLEGVVVPAAPPLPAFGDGPSISAHADGLVCAWITPAAAGAQQNILALRVTRRLAPVENSPVHLFDDVGGQAAPKVVTLGERTYLLHRHRDGKMRLSCFDRALRLVAGFGAAGTVTLAPDARLDAAVSPDLVALNAVAPTDQVACVFPAVGGRGYFIQRFRADTGAAVDAAAISFLLQDGTGPQHALVWNGTRFAVCGVSHPANFQLQLRQMGATGNLLGAGPITVVDQAAECRDPCLIWDARVARYLLVWCDARGVAGGEIWGQFLDANAAAIGAAHVVVSVPAGNRVRRPTLALHDTLGYAVAWEDDTQNGRFDLYFTLLDATARVDGRIPPDASDATSRRLVRLSDTPGDSAGFAALGDASGFSLVYQSPDELNSDRLGVYVVNLTLAGAFEAQVSASTPLLDSGRYVTATALEHTATALTPISAAWAGGAYYLLRVAPDNALNDRLQWVRLHADGRVDASYGVSGVRDVPASFLVFAGELLWTNDDRLITATVDFVGVTLYLHDAQGAPVATFGTNGVVALQDTVTIQDRTCPQVGFFTQPSFHVVVAYGTTQGGALQLRHQRINALGVRVGAAVNLAAADGVAAHNWFQFVNGEARSIAIYHRTDAGITRVRCRRFRLDGTPEGAERALSAAAGEARNGVVCRRPTRVNSSNREYGAAWQYRPNPAAPWEIRFSRLDRQGVPRANPPAPAPPRVVSDVALIDAAAAGWPAATDAVEPQLVCTYTHEPWANPPAMMPAGTSLPEWSPSYGLAWIGVAADGSRTLYFTVFDENGQRLRVPAPPPPAGALPAPVAVAILPLSRAGARVQDFKLVWNGRVFLIDWVEEEAGRLRHRYTLVNRHANQLAHDLPSAALVRATLVNGATNITPGPLPDSAAGYGWGRLNLRQSLAPVPPVTLHVRDDCAIGSGRTVNYVFSLPAGTALLRVTLNWTDPPGPRLVNHLHLTVRAPVPPAPAVRPEFRGNLWSTVAGQTHLSRPIANPPVAADNHENIQTFKQVVIANPTPGDYEVEVSAVAFPADPFNQQNLQSFALVFAGTGPEVVFNQPVATVTGTPVY